MRMLLILVIVILTSACESKFPAYQIHKFTTDTSEMGGWGMSFHLTEKDCQQMIDGWTEPHLFYCHPVMIDNSDWERGTF